MKNDLYIKTSTSGPSISFAPSDTGRKSAGNLADNQLAGKRELETPGQEPLWYKNLINVELYLKSKRL